MRSIFTILLCILFSLHQIDAVAQTYAAGACTPVPSSKTCADATPCKTDTSGQTICLTGATVPKGALQVSQTCWQYNYQYSCANNSLAVNSCTNASWYNKNTCSVVSQSCNTTITETGTCSSYNYTYSCQTSPGQTAQQPVCSNNILNVGNFPTPVNNNNNLAKVATALEIAREAQVYAKCASGDPTTCANSPIFYGVAETCSKGYFGLKNCCNSAPGGSSNSTVLNTALSIGSKVVQYQGEKAVDAVSPYVFDAMYEGGQYLAGIANSMMGVSDVVVASDASQNFFAAGTSLSSGGFSAYGFTLGSTTALAGEGTLGGNIMLTGDFLGQGALIFNPYSLAAAIAIQFVIQIIMQALSCSQEEQSLAMHKGSNLSVYTGEYCSNQIPIIGTCIEYTDTYCSFNSIFAKIMNQQGKAQLGLNFNDCSGLTFAQIGKLDTSKMDFSEMSGQLIQQAQNGQPSSNSIQTNYQPIMQNMMGGTSQNSANGTGYK